MRFLPIILLPLAWLLPHASDRRPVAVLHCEPYADHCRACTDCSACYWCHTKGGTCSVCLEHKPRVH